MGLRGIGARSQHADIERPPLPPRRTWAKPPRNRAEAVCRFIETEVMVTAGPKAGTWMKLRPWQREIINAMYRTDRQGKRLCRRAVVSIARGNGKTGLAAALALAHLVGPEAEPRGSVVCAARVRDQAALVFHEVEAALHANPDLLERVNIRRFNKDVEVMSGPGAGSKLTLMTGNARSAHGLNPSFIIFDELAQTSTTDLYDALVTAMGKRAEPLMFVISTQAHDQLHLMSQLLEYGEKIRAGEITDPSFVSFLHAAPPDCDLLDRDAWRAANPALGDLVSLAHIEQVALEAARSPSREQVFRQLHLNQMVERHTPFISQRVWMACDAAPPPLEALRGQRCVAGLDLSYTRDLTALVMLFDVGERVAAVPIFWLPSDNLAERAVQDRTPWDVWARQGHVRIIPGASIDPAVIAKDIAELTGQNGIRIENLAYDRWRIHDFQRELTRIGCEVPMAPYGQGFRDMAPAVDQLNDLLLTQRLMHGGHPVLNSCVAGAVMTQDAAGNSKPDKVKSTARIDGLVALLMAAGMRRVDPEPATYLERHGELLVV